MEDALQRSAAPTSFPRGSHVPEKSKPCTGQGPVALVRHTLPASAVCPSHLHLTRVGDPDPICASEPASNASLCCPVASRPGRHPIFLNISSLPHGRPTCNAQFDVIARGHRVSLCLWTVGGQSLSCPGEEKDRCPVPRSPPPAPAGGFHFDGAEAGAPPLPAFDGSVDCR